MPKTRVKGEFARKYYIDLCCWYSEEKGNGLERLSTPLLAQSG